MRCLYTACIPDGRKLGGQYDGSRYPATTPLKEVLAMYLLEKLPGKKGPHVYTRVSTDVYALLHLEFSPSMHRKALQVLPQASEACGRPWLQLSFARPHVRIVGSVKSFSRLCLFATYRSMRSDGAAHCLKALAFLRCMRKPSEVD